MISRDADRSVGSAKSPIGDDVITPRRPLMDSSRLYLIVGSMRSIEPREFDG